MIAIWDRSETFAHGYLIVPLTLYLLWRDRDALAALAPRPFLPALLGVAAAGIVWLLAAQLRISSVAQFSMIAMVPLGIWAVLGTAVLRRLAFPLGFLFFAVPIGEFLIPVLMEWTADVTVFAVRASGVPVYREGLWFMIPSGRWSVVEACSGLRYLIASVVVGCLFAHLFYRSPRRRWIFIGVSLLVPIVANWIRAYMIVMLGHLSGNRIAAGADHLLYGWVFFGVVMAILFWFGAKWREDDVRVSGVTRPLVPAATAHAPRRTVQVTLLVTIVLMAVWPLLDTWWRSTAASAPDRTLEAIAGNAGWTVAPEPLSEWRPDVVGATVELSRTFVKDGIRVGLFIALFDDPTSDAKSITSTNQLVLTTNKLWSQVAAGALAPSEGGGHAVRTAVVQRTRERLAVWQWYWIAGRVTTSDLVARFDEMLGLLQGRRKPVAWVIIYTPTEPGEDEVRATLGAFTSAMGASIDAALRKATERP